MCIIIFFTRVIQISEVYVSAAGNQLFQLTFFCREDFFSIRELVKTILHARDPLFGGQGKEETMGLSSWVGGYMREHGSLKLGGGIYERTWVSQAGWGDI